MNEDLSGKGILEPRPSVPEIIRAPNGMEILRRYDVKDLLTAELGADWQKDLFELSRTQGKTMQRDLSDPSCVDLENLGYRTFELRGTTGDVLFHNAPGFNRLYNGVFLDLMRETMNSEEFKDIKIGPYDRSTQEGSLGAAEMYEQLSSSSASTISPSMEPHKDVRSTAILVLEAPIDESGKLVVATHPDVTDVSEERFIKITHKPGTLLCFPRGRGLTHFTEPVNSGQRRLIISINYLDSNTKPGDSERIIEYIKNSATV